MTARSSSRALLRKYVAVGRQASRHRLQERSALVGRNAFLVMVLFVFSRLWQVLLEDSDAARHAGDYVWYLAVAEWVTLSQPALFLEIERDIRMGDIAYHLTRPISYLAFKLSSGLAELAVSMAVMLVTALCTSYALVGGWPSDPLGLLAALPLALAAAVLLLLCGAAIGLSAFWLQDCAPVYWIWQKLLFVLGGLFVPLSMYPGWLGEVAAWSPFSSMLSGPASLVFHFDAWAVVSVAAKLGIWGVLGVVLLRAVYRRALRVIDVHGG